MKSFSTFKYYSIVYYIIFYTIALLSLKADNKSSDGRIVLLNKGLFNLLYNHREFQVLLCLTMLQYCRSVVAIIRKVGKHSLCSYCSKRLR